MSTMSKVILLDVAIVIIIAFTFYYTRSKGDWEKINELKHSNDSLNHRIYDGYDSIYRLNYEVMKRDQVIKSIREREILLQVKYDKTSKHYENEIASFRGASDPRLDSFLLATYPDSTAKRVNRDRPDKR